MIQKNIPAILLLLLLNIHEFIHCSNRRFHKEKKLNDQFVEKMENFFSPEVMRKMMRLMESNNKHRGSKLNGNFASLMSPAVVASQDLNENYHQKQSKINPYLNDLEPIQMSRKQLQHATKFPLLNKFSRVQQSNNKNAPVNFDPAAIDSPVQPLFSLSSSEKDNDSSNENLLHLFHRFG